MGAKGQWVELEPEKYKMVHHSFTEVHAGKQTCSNCGLMALNNPFSQWAVKKGCLHDLHSERRRFK